MPGRASCRRTIHHLISSYEIKADSLRQNRLPMVQRRTRIFRKRKTRTRRPRCPARRRSAKANAENQRTKRSEEHTSELQSRGQLVCRLLLEKKKSTTRHKINNSCKDRPANAFFHIRRTWPVQTENAPVMGGAGVRTAKIS